MNKLNTDLIIKNEKRVKKIINYINNEIEKDEIEAEKSLKEKRFAINVLFESRLAQLKNLKKFIETLN